MVFPPEVNDTFPPIGNNPLCASTVTRTCSLFMEITPLTFFSLVDGDDPKTDIHADGKSGIFNERTHCTSKEIGNSVRYLWIHFLVFLAIQEG